jgi:hypothetical protein
MTNEELIAFLRKNVICVACILASIGIAVAIYMRSDLLPDAEKVFTENAQKAALLAANIEDSQQLKEQHATIVTANQTIANRMVLVGQLAENLQYFYRIESDTGAKLQDLRQIPWSPPARNAPKTFFTPVGFIMAAQGTYPQILDMLRKIENGEHYSRILTCNMHPIGERGTAMQMSLTLELLGVQ